MVITDPTVDYLIRIGNANMVKHSPAGIPASSVEKLLNEILKNKDFIRDYQVEGDSKQDMIKIFLKYGPNNGRVISGLKCISKPGLGNYVSAENLPKVPNGFGIAIISTSAGVITDEETREKNVDGEVIVCVW